MKTKTIEQLEELLKQHKRAGKRNLIAAYRTVIKALKAGL